MEIPVKNHLPTVVTCPFCRKQTLGIYVAPTVGGRWYYCKGCGFRGDSIELYFEAHKLPDIRDAVFELVSKQILPLTREQVPLEVINRYVISYVERRKKFTAVFAAAQEAMQRLDPESLSLLEELHLWGGYQAGRWHQRLSQLVGVYHPKRMRDDGFSVSRDPGLARMLVCPFYDIPGRICSLQLIGFHGATQRIHLAEALPDDGLMMLDTLDIHNDAVLAFADPIFAMQIQRKQFNMTGRPIPMVVHGNATSRAWQSVSARRVIYWNHVDDDFWTYKQALQHPRAFIATKPRFTDQATYLSSRLLPEIMRSFHDHARPWAEAMKRVILNGEHWRVSDFVINMKLSAPDLQRIYDVCSPSEKRRVMQALGEVPFDRFVIVANMRISESDDGWWIINQDVREMGCSAIIRLDSAIHVPDADENYYEGVIISKGKQIQFQEKMDVIEKNTAIWLRNLMMRNGLGPPIIQQRMKSHLIEIAKQFQEPQYVQRSGRVGWSAELQGFVFPNFTVRYGGIDETSRALVYDKNVPAANITSTALSGDWDQMLDDTPENAAIWAGLSCFMTNMMAPVLSAEQLATGFIGGSGSISRIVGRHLAAELGMTPVTITKKHVNPESITKDHTHGYPVWVELPAAKRPLTSQLTAAEGGNFMLDLLEGEATALGVGDKWVFVNAPAIANQSSKLPSMRGVMRYLAWIQSQSFVLQPATSLHMSVLMSLSEWAAAELSITDYAVFKRAESMLWAPDRFSIEQRMMHLIYWLISNGNLKLTIAPFYDKFTAGALPSKKGVLVDQTAGKVFISIGDLRAAIRSARLPSPFLDEALRHAMASQQTMGFEMGNDCFVVGHKYWSDELARWRQLRL